MIEAVSSSAWVCSALAWSFCARACCARNSGSGAGWTYCGGAIGLLRDELPTDHFSSVGNTVAEQRVGPQRTGAPPAQVFDRRHAPEAESGEPCTAWIAFYAD